MSRAFTSSRIGALGPRIEEVASELFERARASTQPVDFVAALASPLPVTVISELLGVPTANRAALVAWSDAMARGLEPPFLLSAEVQERLEMAREEFASFLRDLIAHRRRSPGDDLLSALVGISDGGDVLTEEELIATCILILVAGHETTTSLISAAVLGLARHPEQLARLHAEPELAANAVEEFLRYDPPVQVTVRFALVEASVGGLPVPAGSLAVLLIGAANRDPALCTEPDRLDIGRPPSHHLAFGQGIHFCLGAPLARLETQTVLRLLVGRSDGLHVTGEPSWKENTVLRGLHKLPISFSPDDTSTG